jgi:hypothetical protein
MMVQGIGLKLRSDRQVLIPDTLFAKGRPTPYIGVPANKPI